jgi:tetratricopeptide (TPR) repeat protein
MEVDLNKGWFTSEEIYSLYEEGKLFDNEGNNVIGVGNKTIRNLWLRVYGEKKTVKFPRLDYPPKAFISYKWGSNDHNQKIQEFCTKLQQNGWIVIFDRFYNISSDDKQIADFISEMEGCRLVIGMVDEGYIYGTGMHISLDDLHSNTNDNKPIRDTWLLDEYQMILYNYLEKKDKRDIDKFELLLLLIDGEIIPEPYRAPNLIDVRKFDFTNIIPNQLAWNEPTLSKDAIEEILSITGTLPLGDKNLYDTTIKNINLEKLKSCIDKYPFVADLWVILTQYYKLTNNYKEYFSNAKQSLTKIYIKRNEYLSILEDLLIELWTRKEYCDITKFVFDETLNFPRNALLQFISGDVLDEKGQHWAGLNHVLFATLLDPNDSDFLNSLGVIYFRLGTLKLAISAYAKSLKINYSLRTHTNLIESLFYSYQLKKCIKEAESYQKNDTNNDKVNEIYNIAIDLKDQPKSKIKQTIGFIVDERISVSGMLCSQCSSFFPITAEEKICAKCGSIYHQENICPICAHWGCLDLRIYETNFKLLCPICRSGLLIKSNNIYS